MTGRRFRREQSGSRKQETGSRRQGWSEGPLTAAGPPCFTTFRSFPASCFPPPVSCLLEESRIHNGIKDRPKRVREPEKRIVFVAREQRPPPQQHVRLVALTLGQVHLVVDPAVAPAEADAEPAEQAHAHVAR